MEDSFIQKKLNLSISQKNLYFQYHLNTDKTTYNVGMAFLLNKHVNLRVLRQAIKEIFLGNDNFQMNFLVLEKEPVALLRKRENLKIQNLSWSDLSANDKKGILGRLLKLKNKEFDLGKDPLYRSYIVELKENAKLLVMNMHHLVADGWAFGLIIKLINKRYSEILLGADPRGMQVNPAYQDFIQWQKSRYNAEKLNNIAAYWCEKFSQFEVGPLKFFRRNWQPVPSKQQYNYSLPKSQINKLEEFSKENDLSVFSCLVSSYQLLLWKYTAQENFTVGVPFHSRMGASQKETIGCFVNLLPLCININASDPINCFIRKNREFIRTARGQQPLELSRLSNLLRTKGLLDASEPIFNTIFNLVNVPMPELLHADQTSEMIWLDGGANEYDLAFEIQPKDSSYEFKVSYNASCFNESEIQKMISCYVNILNHLINNPAAPLSSIKILSAADEKALFNLGRGEEATEFYQSCLHELFELQAERTPENIAVEFEKNSMTYEELNRKSNLLANYLCSKSLPKETIIGIYFERSIEMVISILAILKAGCAYLPIDVDLPKNRLRYILSDSGVSILLLQKELKEKVISFVERELPELFSVDLENLDNISSYASKPVSRTKVNAKDLAYVLYTSGTTGEPKGVMVEHQSISNRIIWMKKQFSIVEEDNILQKTNYCFDVSLWEIFLPIIAGSKLVLLPPKLERDPAELLACIEKYRITILHFVPSMLKEFLDFQELANKASSLKKVFCSGEALTKGLQDKYFKVLNSDLYNLYGPTEAAVDVTFYQCQKSSKVSPAIGKPISNTQLFVLDSQMNLLPPGVQGELYIGGVAVARGYYNREKLQKERFVLNPFDLENKFCQFLYKTGDIVRWSEKYLTGLNLEYIGRIDSQVKIRGYRVELAEVETVLRQYHGIEDVVVLKRKLQDDDKLVAYYVSEDADLDLKELRAYLAENISHYMIPHFFQQIDKVPVTPIGKIDRKKLSNYLFSNNLLSGESLFRNPKLEQLIAEVWEKALEITRIDRSKNFFELGGDSITAIRVVRDLIKKKINIRVDQIFKWPTVFELSKNVSFKDNLPTKEGCSPRLSGPISKTPIQEWFLANCFLDENTSNQSMLLEIPKKYHSRDIETALAKLADQCDSFKLRFKKLENEVDLYFDSNFPSAYEFCLVKLSPTEKLSSIERIRSFSKFYEKKLDIENGPLAYFIFFESPKDHQKNYLLLMVHHLIIDGVSWQILLENLNELISFPSGSDQCVSRINGLLQWGSNLFENRQYFQSNEYYYWLQRLDNFKERKIILNRSERLKESQLFHISFSKESTHLLMERACGFFNATVNDLLLAALYLAYYKWSGENSFLFCFEGHGREEIFSGEDLLSDSVGWFTNICPVAFSFFGCFSVGKLVEYVKEYLKGIPNKGLGYGVIRYLSAERELPCWSEFEIFFNYFGDITGSMKTNAFSFSDEFHAHQIGSNLMLPGINIVGSIKNSSLHFTFSCEYELVQDLRLEDLAASYEKSILTIISSSLASQERSLPEFDFSLLNRTEEEINWILENNKFYGGVENISSLLPFLPSQIGIIFESMRFQGEMNYFTVTEIVFNEEVNKDALRVACGNLIDTYSVLRAGLCYDKGGQPLQILYKEVSTDLQEVASLSCLLKPPYSSVFRVSTDEEGFSLFFQVNHLFIDGWSNEILIGKLLEFYDNELRNLKTTVNSETSYEKYHEILMKKDSKVSRSFWRDYLDNLTKESLYPLPELKLDKNRSSRSFSTLRFSVGKTDIAMLHDLSLRIGVTKNNIFQGLFALALSCCGGNFNILYGTVSSRHPCPEIEVMDLVGMFINVLPVYVCLENMPSVLTLFAEIQNLTEKRMQHDFLSLGEIQKCTAFASERELVKVLFVYENYPVHRDVIKKRNLPVSSINVYDNNHYPFSLIVLPGEEFEVCLRYDTGCFEESAIGRFKNCFDELTRKIFQEKIFEIDKLLFLGGARHEIPGLIYRDSTELRDQPMRFAPHPATEEILINVWKEVLGYPEIHLDDDFFEVGGDSLLAIRLVNKMNEKLNQKISVHSLICSPTIRKLSELLSSFAQPSSVCVQLQQGDPKKPVLFLIHPVGGHVYIYRDLVACLPDIGAYGIQDSRIMSNDFSVVKSIEEMAAEYISAILEIQPLGPYYLAGSSLGGALAFEIAQQLITQGKQVALLALLDTPGPNYHAKKPLETDLEILSYLFGLNLGLDLFENTEQYEILGRLSLDGKLDHFVKLEKDLGMQDKNSNRIKALLDLRRDQIRQFLDLFKINAEAGRRYLPKFYDGELLFFRAMEADSYNVPNLEQDWQRLSRNMQVVDVPGNHLTMNYSPHVKVIANHLIKYLGET